MASRIRTSQLSGAIKGVRGYTTPSAPSMAILDDYLSVSRPHFNKISTSKLNVEVFKSHLPQRTAEERTALVEKLKPFSVISTMRERTQFPASVLKELPNLKLLLCSKQTIGTCQVSSLIGTSWHPVRDFRSQSRQRARHHRRRSSRQRKDRHPEAHAAPCPGY